jgi:hypothetical protein
VPAGGFEGLTLTEIARRLGIKSLRLNLHPDKVTARNFLKVRALYRALMLEGPAVPLDEAGAATSAPEDSSAAPRAANLRVNLRCCV